MRFNDKSRRDIRDNAELLFKRLKHTNRFPVRIGSPYSTYRALMPPHIHEAIKVIEQDDAYVGLLDVNRSSSLRIKLETNEEGRSKTASIMFTWKGGKPSVSSYRRNTFIDDDNEYYEIIRLWALRAIEVNERILFAIRWINHLSRECNTPGQWNTVFPDFVHLLPENVKAEIAKMKKRSPIPYSIQREDVRSKTPIVAESLATAILLPTQEPSVWIE